MGEQQQENKNGPDNFCRSVFFFVASYGIEVISAGGHTKKHIYLPTELFTPFEALYKTCLLRTRYMWPRRTK